MTEPVLRIPLSQIEEHPDFRLRLEYEHLDELEQSFVETAKAEWAAGRTDSNGQREPGRAVLSKDGKTWELYCGLRRRLAMQKAYETTKDKRFSYYWLHDDTGITREEMLSRALEDRTGIRENLTDLEEVRVVKTFPDVDIKKMRYSGSGGRLEALQRAADLLTDEQLSNLHKIERKTEHALSLSALVFLTSVAPEAEMYKTAAEMAEHKYDRSQKKMEEARRFKEEALRLPWFQELFPDAKESDITPELRNLAQEVKEEPSVAQGPLVLRVPAEEFVREGEEAHAEEEVRAEKAPAPVRGITAENVLLFRCPHCGGPGGFEMHTIAFEGYLPSFAGKPATPFAMEQVAGDSPAVECESCGKQYYFEVKKGADGKFYAATRKRPGDVAKEVDKWVPPATMIWDDRRGCWEVLGKDGGVSRRISIAKASAEAGKKRK